MEQGSEIEDRRKDSDRAARRAFAIRRVSRIQVAAVGRVQRESRIGSRRPRFAGQLISHFFDEDPRVIRGVPFAAIQVVITGGFERAARDRRAGEDKNRVGRNEIKGEGRRG